MSPGWRQTIIWTNAGIFLIGRLGTNFSGILIEKQAKFQEIWVKDTFRKDIILLQLPGSSIRIWWMKDWKLLNRGTAVPGPVSEPLQWCHNERDGVSNHRTHDSFTQPQIKEDIKAPRHWPLWGEFTGARWIRHTKGQWHGKSFHWMTSLWRHRFSYYSKITLGYWFCLEMLLAHLQRWCVADSQISSD